jgi:hypothetical protein
LDIVADDSIIAATKSAGLEDLKIKEYLLGTNNPAIKMKLKATVDESVADGVSVYYFLYRFNVWLIN